MFLKHPYKEPLEHRLSILTRNLSFIIIGFLKHPYKEPLEHRLSILTRNLSFIIVVFLKHPYKEPLEHRLSILTRNLSFIIIGFLKHPYKEPLERRLSILTRNLSFIIIGFLKHPYKEPVRAHPLALLRRRVPPITVGPHPGSQYLAPALALGSPVLAPQGHPTSGYLVKSPLTISFASVRVRSCELRRYNHPRHTLTTN